MGEIPFFKYEVVSMLIGVALALVIASHQKLGVVNGTAFLSGYAMSLPITVLIFRGNENDPAFTCVLDPVLTMAIGYLSIKALFPLLTGTWPKE